MLNVGHSDSSVELSNIGREVYFLHLINGKSEALKIICNLF